MNGSRSSRRRRSEKAGPLWDALRHYLDSVALTRRPNTVRTRRTTVTCFIRFLEAHDPEVRHFADLRRIHIEGWLRSTAMGQRATATRRSNILGVRCFLETLAADGWPDAPESDLIRRSDMPPRDKHLPRPLSPEHDRALQHRLAEMPGRYPKALLLLRKTGMRIGELQNLEQDALKSLPNGQWALHVPLGKLHSERVIPVDGRTAALFQDLIRIQRDAPLEPHPDTGKPTRFLLRGRSGRRVPSCHARMRKYLRQAAREAGINERVTPHMLRHSFATEMARAGMSLPVLKEILGHRCIRMTLGYVQVTQIDIQKAYLAAMQAIEKRYSFPAPKEIRRPERLVATRPNIVHVLRTTAALMESLRRDKGSHQDKKMIQRLVERIRRLAGDAAALLQ